MILIVMGVSGAGKTTIGRLLAAEMGWRFYEGDHFHTPASIAKMEHAIPLTDEDRKSWLDALRRLIDRLVRKGDPAVIACSALKRNYREHLAGGHANVFFVYLKGDYELIQKRLEKRSHHFMKADLLKSQFDTLEEPEGVLTVDVSRTPQAIVQQIKEALPL